MRVNPRKFSLTFEITKPEKAVSKACQSLKTKVLVIVKSQSCVVKLLLTFCLLPLRFYLAVQKRQDRSEEAKDRMLIEV